MLTNFLIFLGVLFLIIILWRTYKSLKIVESKEKEICKFRISKPRFRTSGLNKTAKFSVILANKHTFFIDFPISFKFYSNTRFKSKIKISYSTPGNGKSEQLVNKVLVFETKQLESLKHITDIIVGKINFEIELNVDYGYPIIDFEIMKNSFCELTKEHKITIVFPK